MKSPSCSGSGEKANEEIITAFLAFATILIPAANAHASSGWSPPLTIISFIPTDTDLKLIVSGNSSNPLGCTISDWVKIKPTDGNYTLIASGIVTALAQGKTIKVWESNCEADGMVHFIALWIDR